jgi:acetyltransferase-like isoleucine patch superfamily enzyme
MANVESGAVIGRGVKVWANAHIRSHASIGENTVVGEGAYIGTGVSVGQNSKIQNNALIYEPATIGRGVFVGPGAILTNDQFPRAVSPDERIKDASDWKPVGVTVENGASIGAGAICVAPVKIGEWSVVGAGAVVVKDVIPFSLVVGSPARQIGWVGKAGFPLVDSGAGSLVCPSTGEKFQLIDGRLLPN